MATLNNRTPSSTYGGLLNIDNSNNGIDSTLRPVQDGLGNSAGYSISSTTYNITASVFQINGKTVAIAGNVSYTGAFNVSWTVGASVTVILPIVSGLTLATLSGTEAFSNKTITVSTYNGLNIANTTGTLTIANGKTFQVNNTLVLQGTDGSTVSLGVGGTVVYGGGTCSGTSSGTNTGDQTNITGNAGTVTTNANMTGDVTSIGNATTYAGIVPASKGGAGIAVSSSVIQRVSVETGTVSTGTTIVPFDNTIPQNTEGDQYMSLAITPKSASSILKIEVVIQMGASIVSEQGAALFQDSTAGALAAMSSYISAGGQGTSIKFTHIMTSGTTSTTTFKVRGGANGAGTTTFNGNSGAQVYGGIMASSIVITEYTA